MKYARIWTLKEYRRGYRIIEKWFDGDEEHWLTATVWGTKRFRYPPPIYAKFIRYGRSYVLRHSR